MKNENSTPHLSVNGTDYTLSYLLVCSSKERTSGESSKCQGKVKQGLCLSTGPTSKAVLQVFTSSSVSVFPAEDQPWNLQDRGLSSKVSSNVSQCLHSPVCWESLPFSLGTTEDPSLDGPAPAHWGPCAHRALNPWGIYTQTKFWIFGYDPGITSTKSMDFPQIYFSIMS